MKLSVILSTYNQPRWLEKVLWGYAVQSHPPDEVVVADDGSDARTAEVVRRVGADTALPLVHCWHEDVGFRKCLILNRAILSAMGDYLVFSDGDCLPRDDFVEQHRRLARPGRYLSGAALRAPLELSEAISLEDIRARRFLQREWLRAQGVSFGRRGLRLVREPWLPALADALTTSRPWFNGGNASAWRSDIERVNGFDCTMEYGWEDRSLGVRLRNAGVRPGQVRNRAVVLHLEHDRPYRTRASLERGLEVFKAVRRAGTTWVDTGIDSIAAASDAATSTPRRSRTRVSREEVS